MSTEDNKIVELDVSKSYIAGKLSCIECELKAAEQYISTLKREKCTLMRTLEDRTKLSKDRIHKVRSRSTVDIVVNLSSHEEYMEDNNKKEIKLILFFPKSTIPL